VKPDIILTTVSRSGAKGRWKYVGFDVGQAMSGVIYMTGEPDHPYRASVAWVDFSTALHCAFGTLIALMERKRSGKGQIVKGSLLGSALTLGNAMLIEQGVLGINRKPTGNRGQTAAPVDLFRATDGWILCQVIGKPLYERWAKLMGEPGWLTDPRFQDDISRGDNGAVISERMQRWCATRTSTEVIETLGKASIPCGPVLSPQQTLDHPQVAAMEILQPLDFPGLPKPAPVACRRSFYRNGPRARTRPCSAPTTRSSANWGTAGRDRRCVARRNLDLNLDAINAALTRRADRERDLRPERSPRPAGKHHSGDTTQSIGKTRIERLPSHCERTAEHPMHRRDRGSVIRAERKAMQ
jgi:crotonobetainyl-CoA:carnitine CoA-transferase CaiB-like acyl-CoA transferase